LTFTMWRSLYGAVCCSMVQCVAVWRSVLQYGAVRCSALQCVLQSRAEAGLRQGYVSVLQCVAVVCSMLQLVAVH